MRSSKYSGLFPSVALESGEGGGFNAASSLWIHEMSEKNINRTPRHSVIFDGYYPISKSCSSSSSSSKCVRVNTHVTNAFSLTRIIN